MKKFILLMATLLPLSCYSQEMVFKDLWISHALNHADLKSETYQEHIQILHSKDTPNNSPVVFFLGGEGGPSDLKKLAAPYMLEHKAIYIQADHRGYGSYSNDADQSIPTYVNSHEALQDFHEDIVSLKNQLPGPWIVVGTSYSGTLAIELASEHPEDVSAVISSSGITSFKFISTDHDSLMRSTWGSELYEKMADYIQQLRPSQDFDGNWSDRIFLQYMLVGTVQYKKFDWVSKLFPYLDWMPVDRFISLLKVADHKLAGDLGTRFSRAQGERHLNLEQAKTQNFHGRFWAYQQCREFGSFFMSTGPGPSIFTQDMQDYVRLCQKLFSITPNTNMNTDIKQLIANLKVPIVYVTGAKDPWFKIELQQTDALPLNSKYIVDRDGYHCPERDSKDLSKEVIHNAFELIK